MVQKGHREIQEALPNFRIRRIGSNYYRLETEKGLVEIRVCDDCQELVDFVFANIGYTCHCQKSRPDVEKNYHAPSCIVGKARAYIEKIGTIIEKRRP